MIFMNNLSYMQSIKQFADDPLSLGCTIYLSNCLYIRFDALTDDLLSVGCTCLYFSKITLTINLLLNVDKAILW